MRQWVHTTVGDEGTPKEDDAGEETTTTINGLNSIGSDEDGDSGDGLNSIGSGEDGAVVMD